MRASSHAASPARPCRELATEGRVVAPMSARPDAKQRRSAPSQIASLKRLGRGSKVLLLDRNGSTAKTIAKELAKLGFGKVRAQAVRRGRRSARPNQLVERRPSGPQSTRATFDDTPRRFPSVRARAAGVCDRRRLRRPQRLGAEQAAGQARRRRRPAAAAEHRAHDLLAHGVVAPPAAVALQVSAPRAPGRGGAAARARAAPGASRQTRDSRERLGGAVAAALAPLLGASR